MPRDDASTVREAIEKLDRNIVNALKKLRPVPQEKAGTEGGDGADLASHLKSFFPHISQRVSQAYKLGSAIGGAMGIGRAAGAAAGAGEAAEAGGAAVAGGEAAAGGAAALASNPVGWALAVVAAAALVAAAFVALPTVIHKFLDSLLEANRALAEVSPSMAIVIAQSDFRNIMRDMRKGEALAPSAKALSDALGNLKDSALDLEVTFLKMVNYLGVVLAGFAETVAGAIKIIWGGIGLNKDRVAEGVQDVRQGIDDMGVGIRGIWDVVKGIDRKMPEGEIEPMSDFFNRVAKDGQAARDRNDPRFGRVMGSS